MVFNPCLRAKETFREQLMFNALRRVQIHFLERLLGTKLSLSEQLCYLARRKLTHTHTRTNTITRKYSSMTREVCLCLKVQL